MGDTRDLTDAEHTVHIIITVHNVHLSNESKIDYMSFILASYFATADDALRGSTFLCFNHNFFHLQSRTLRVSERVHKTIFLCLCT